MMTVRLALGLILTAAAFTLAGRRLVLLYRIGRAGQPADPGRTEALTTRLRAEVTEVLGHRKLLTWTVPGVAFALIRRQHSPACEGRRSRSFGSHLDAAWLVQHQGLAGAQLEVTDVAEILLRSIRSPAPADTRDPERAER